MSEWRYEGGVHVKRVEHDRHIYCMGCDKAVLARLTNGAERYPHRPDLADVPQYTHDECGTWVGTHHKSTRPLKPLGVLATPEMYKARIAIHDLIDPIWKSGKRKRGQVYAHLSRELGYQYHTGELRTIEEARKVWLIVKKYQEQINDE